MKQILQSFKTGIIELADIPVPQLKTGHLLIQTRCSLISAGTERMLLEFGRGNWLQKIRQQPDKVKQVLEKVKTDGLLTTLEAVQDKLDQAIPMGYCNVGEVIAVGAGVTDFAVGERVVSNGQHAEIVQVPKNLCAKIPAHVADEAAVFTVLSAIALQGIRLLKPTLGESIAVMGLGLLGQLAVQLLLAQGCRVLALDLNEERLALAKKLGAETINLANNADPVAAAVKFSRGAGIDGVLITAATDSNEPVHQAAQMSRKRGRIILVGVAGLELSRADFYEKELSFQVSCSYGPGRYDTNYEVQGNDYPIGYVRWTEQRNFVAVLDMLANQKLIVTDLISHRFNFLQAAVAYDLLVGKSASLGIILNYAATATPINELLAARTLPLAQAVLPVNEPCLGMIGAGNYAGRVLIPAFKATAIGLKTIACTQGVSGAHQGKKYGFSQVTTDTTALMQDAQINVIAIATRHDTHANFVLKALTANKHVFVEKPLCVTLAELEEIKQLATTKSNCLLMVGFNRRFAPHIQKIKTLLNTIAQPKAFIMTVNAGAVPMQHWTQDKQIGGGRIIGEACHFIDLLRYLADTAIIDWTVMQMDKQTDSVTIQLKFVDGSIGTVHYLANGHKAVAKERLEIFCGGRILQLDNFRKLTGYGWPQFKKMNLWRQDKGQAACVAAFVAAIRTGQAAPISLQEIMEVSELTINIANSIGPIYNSLGRAENQ